MQHEKCYVFDSKAARPTKRRCVEPRGLDTSLDLRKRAFTAFWSRQEKEIHEVVRDSNGKTLRQILDFISTASSTTTPSRIPAGFVTTGSGSITHASLFNQLASTASAEDHDIHVSLTPSDSSNLKTLLKNLITKITRVDGSDDEDGVQQTRIRKGPKLLSYDLHRILQWSKTRDVAKIVISLQDSEAFDIAVLTEFLLLLQSWLDRLPFVMLFGVATSVDLFTDRLPRAALKCIFGQSFNAAASDDLLERVYEQSVFSSNAVLRLGPALSDMILQRQKDYTQSIESFTDSLKYAYMCHFYGNPLSVFLDNDLAHETLDVDHYEAVRHLPSFRSHLESLLNHKEAPRVRSLLDSDKQLSAAITNGVSTGMANIEWMVGAVRMLQELRCAMEMRTSMPFSALWIKACSGELATSAILRELLLLTKRAPSDTLGKILPTIIDTLMTMPASELGVSPDDFRDIQEELAEILAVNNATNGPLRSEHDMKHNTLRTTVVAHKVELSKAIAKLSKSDDAYSQLVSRFHDLLESYFTLTLSGIQTIFLHELLFYDQRAGHRDVFTPRPRFAIERALSAPFDYLGCSCCADAKESLSPSQPPTAILYQLYLETGALINTADLWSAFQAILGERYGEGDEENTTTVALFFRSLAELKHLGLVRQSRKKMGHLAKLAWKGL